MAYWPSCLRRMNHPRNDPPSPRIDLKFKGTGKLLEKAGCPKTKPRNESISFFKSTLLSFEVRNGHLRVPLRVPHSPSEAPIDPEVG